ncbi:MAG: Hsp20/alpha crystallin family protein [Acidobacteriota bacterium]
MPSDVKPYLTMQGPYLERLRESLQRLFTELMMADQEVVPAPGQWLPPVDLSESPDMITVKVELPGVDAEDVRVSVLGNELKIAGQKREEHLSARPVCYICMERSYGSFVRSLKLYWPVDARAAIAELVDGVLIIRLPKLKDRRKREIVIPVQRGES